MSSQEAVDFVNERLKTEAGKNRPLSAIIEEVSTGKCCFGGGVFVCLKVLMVSVMQLCGSEKCC